MATATLQQSSIALDVSNGEVKAPSRRDVSGIFHYLDRSISEQTLNEKTNIATPNTYGAFDEAVACIVEDVTGRESQFTLEKHGFEYRKHPTQLRLDDWEDQDKVRAVYYPETVEIIKKATGASLVRMFNHLTRISHGIDPQPMASKVQRHHQAYRTHVDQDYAQVEKHIRTNFSTEEAERLMKKRFQIINVWRPIETIYKDPLAIADINSISPDDFVTINITLPDGRQASNLAVRSNSNHRWYYKYAQKPDEVLVFKQFDNSKAVVCSGQIPHTSFIDVAEEGSYPRRSIEARALAFYED
ncbi:hypothetical protein V8E51_011735 [Hyaloscypha variabilis]